MSVTDRKTAVAVLGAGSWGTALASLIARNGHPTTLWGRNAEQIEAIDCHTAAFVANPDQYSVANQVDVQFSGPIAMAIPAAM